MLSTLTMAPSPSPASPHLPAFSFDFTSAYKPSVSSPLSSPPTRTSQTSPPLSPINPNSVTGSRMQRGFHSSPILPVTEQPPKFKFAARDVKKNPLRQNRESAQESRRKLFLRNVRQRADDRAWERRGGDQEVLKLEWAALNHQRRRQKDMDIDGLVFEDDLEDSPEENMQNRAGVDDESMILDEEAELEARSAEYEAQSSQQHQGRPGSPSLSDDDDYDSLFMDFLSQQQNSGQDIVLSGDMDMS